MPTAALTDRLLRSLEAPPEGRITYHDERLPDFGVRVGINGRSFFVRYRTSAGRRRQITLGRYPVLGLAEARAMAKDVLGQVARGEDPVGRERAAGMTVRAFAEVYMEKHARPNKRSWKDDDRKLTKDILPRLGDRPVAEVKRTDLVEVLDAIADRGSPVQANRTRALLSKFFRLAMERGVIELSPAQGLPRYAKERPRERVLSEEELRAVWDALAPEHPVTAGVFKVAILAGQRMGETQSMRGDDLDESWWTIPPERTKNRLTHRVPLSAETIEVLEGVRVVTGPPDPWVFPSPRSGHVQWTNKAAIRLRERSRVEFRPHDLRRTMATHLTRMGVPRLVVAKILNHKDSGVTAVYDRASYEREKREALTVWGERVRGMVEWREGTRP